jgi:hypothetical protein
MPVKPAFQPDVAILELSRIRPIKTMRPVYRQSETYRRIAASIEHVGLIEPLVVFPADSGSYLLLDGHTRLDILVARGVTETKCLLATDNEAYTYNRRVNYIPPIAQHQMILAALRHVSEDRIASSLNVSVAAIREKRDLLRGICSETADILKNERVSMGAFATLRKMKPIRQIEVAGFMVSAHKFSSRFADALLNSTRDELLVSPHSSKSRRMIPGPEKSLLEQETDELMKRVSTIRATYGAEILELTAACGYVSCLLENVRVRRFLAKNHGTILEGLEKLIGDLEYEKRRMPQSEIRSSPDQQAAPVGVRAAS